MEKLSVLMSLYYKEKLKNFEFAIDSILKQTYPFNEIVLVVDGPIPVELEGSVKKYKSILQHKLIIIKNPENLGLAKSLNIGLKYCNNDLVARMDTDDYSLPNRFEQQLKTLIEIKDSNLAIIGSWHDIYDENLKKYVSTRKVPKKNEEIRNVAKYRTPINHPTIIFRKKAVLDVGGYPENLGRFEDWGLCLRLLKRGYSIYNIQKSLLKVRTSVEQMQRRGGIKYLIEEITTLNTLKKDKLINGKALFFNILVRVPVRLFPNIIRKYIYYHIIWKK